MSTHLLLIALGPVQDFIAQARRTRDLWYGSYLLSELGRAAAVALQKGGGKLIFPAVQNGQLPQNVANKLLVEVPEGTDPQSLAVETRATVFGKWRELSQAVKTIAAGLLAPGTDEVWDEQIASLLEFSASWLPLGEYADIRRKLESAIAGRKLLRDFDSWTKGRGNVPKSSLDGARETVLSAPKQRKTDLTRKYRIADGEQLDAVALVKRAGGDPSQFLPVVNVALSSWIAQAASSHGPLLDALREACKQVGVSRISRDLPSVKVFPFDASVLLSSRWNALFEEQGLTGDPQAWGKANVRPLLKVMGEPYPYVACLTADGDRMGVAIDDLTTADEHRNFSIALAGFADAARTIVEEQHGGSLVYAGGDDVLAFVPLQRAVACADALRHAFEVAMSKAVPSNSRQPTLSVGLGIGHIMESMSCLLELGRDAEREAKKNRNTLSITVDKRSGGSTTWSVEWSGQPAATLRQASELMRDELSSRKVYEIARLLKRFPNPADAREPQWPSVLALEVQRSLARVEGSGLSLEQAGLLLDPGIDYKILHSRVRDWVDRMLIARTFAQAEVGK